MTRSWLQILVSAALLASGPSVRAGDDEFEFDRVVVRLVAGAPIAEVTADYGTAVVDAVEPRRLYLLDVPDGLDEDDFAKTLAMDPRVEFADLNFFARDPGPGTQSFYLASSRVAFEQQYARALIGLPGAHGIATGVGVVVAVLDTGVDAVHPALAGRILPDGYNFVDNSADVSDVPDGMDTDHDGVFDEMVGHGTFVAGLVVMAAPGVSILPIKVMDSDGLGTSFRVARGVDFAVAAGADVINLSLGALGDNSVLTEATRWAEEAGVSVLAAAGNEGHDSPPWSPSSIPFSVAVAATDAEDVRAPFTNYGEHIDLCGPGVEIVSALPDGAYGVASGTSYACPLVAGVSALVLERRPASTPDDLADRLRSTAVSINVMNPGFDGRLGAGRIDAAAAVAGLCPADFDGDGAVNSGDFFAFLDAYFAGDAAADANGDGAINSGDFFAFLAVYFGGCA